MTNLLGGFVWAHMLGTIGHSGSSMNIKLLINSCSFQEGLIIKCSVFREEDDWRLQWSWSLPHSWVLSKKPDSALPLQYWQTYSTLPLTFPLLPKDVLNTIHVFWFELRCLVIILSLILPHFVCVSSQYLAPLDTCGSLYLSVFWWSILLRWKDSKVWLCFVHYCRLTYVYVALCLSPDVPRNTVRHQYLLNDPMRERVNEGVSE